MPAIANSAQAAPAMYQTTGFRREPHCVAIPQQFKPAAIKPEVAELIHGNRHGTPSAGEV